jgi:magnesium chelatase family protein
MEITGTIIVFSFKKPPIYMCPCPCGYYNDSVKERTCSNSVITRYQKRNSGLMLDRIDFHTEVQRVENDKLRNDRLGKIIWCSG